MSTANELDPKELVAGVKVLRAYTECSDEIQAGIRDMLSILSSPESDDGDRAMALHSLADALYPNLPESSLGLDVEQSDALSSDSSGEAGKAIEESLDEEECAFARRLTAVMEERGMTQLALAEITGVGQPAISNMLNRQCRPQRRTIGKFAEALGVSPESLWPGFGT